MAITPYGWEEGDGDDLLGLIRQDLVKQKHNYTQCLLMGKEGDQRVAWIPSDKANLERVKINEKLFTVKEKYNTITLYDNDLDDLRPFWVTDRGYLSFNREYDKLRGKKRKNG
jgi:hypothetical protein